LGGGEDLVIEKIKVVGDKIWGSDEQVGKGNGIDGVFFVGVIRV